MTEANTNDKKIRVFFVRHGQTNHNLNKIFQGHLNTNLNQDGMDQAKLAAEFFKDFPIDHMYSSDLQRCVDTASTIHSKLTNPVKIEYSSQLRERYMGPIEGMKINDAIEFAKKDGKTYKDYGETPHVLVERVQKELNRILELNKGNKNIIICSHGGTIRTILKILNYNKDLIVYNTSVTTVDFDKLDFNKFEILKIGDTGHLGDGTLEVVDTRIR